MSQIVLGKCGKENVSIDLTTLLRTRLLAQANSGGGKSWFLRRLAEQLFGKVQTIIIDREGEFASLREKYGFLHVGEGGDTPADLRSARMVAEKILELNASAVIDLYEAFRKRPLDRRAYVRDFLETLIDAPKKLWRDLVVIVDEAHQFCLDSETEILTREGWRSWGQVSVKDTAVAFDTGTTEYRYEPIERVILRPYKGEMVSLKSDGIDALVTPDHRVVYQTVQRAPGRYGKMYAPTLRAAADLPQHINIPIGKGPFGPGLPDFNLDELRLLGFLVTDGQFCGGGPYLGISQTHKTTKGGQSMVAVLDELKEQCGIASVHERPERTTWDPKEERTITHAPSCVYYFGSSLSKKFLAFLGETIHQIPRKLLDLGTQEQLEAFFLGILNGDGTNSGNRNWGYDGWTAIYPGKNEGLADDLQELCTRLGISAVKSFVPSLKQWHMRISKRTSHYIRKTGREQYDGLTWDITVPSGAFVARRRGKVFVTGNCPQESPKAASMVEREIIAGCKDAMVSLATVGRKRGYAAIWVTQRLAKLDKDASAELMNRLVGMTFEDVDVDRAAELMSVSRDEKGEFKRALKNLDPGYFYGFGRAISKDRILVKIGPVKTSHPEPGSSKHAAAPPPAPEKIRALLPKLKDLPQIAEAKAKTEVELRQEVKSLKAQILKAKIAKPEPKRSVPVVTNIETKIQTKIQEVPVMSKKEYQKVHKVICRMEQVAQRLSKIGNMEGELRSVYDLIGGKLSNAVEAAENLRNKKDHVNPSERRLRSYTPSTPKPAPVPDRKPNRVPAPARKTLADVTRDPVQENGDLSKPQQRMLRSLAEFEAIGIQSVPRTWLAGWLSIKANTGNFKNNIGALRTKGYVEYEDESIVLTEAGRAAAPTPELEVTPEAIFQRCCRAVTSPQEKMLRVIHKQYPEWVSRDDVADELGIQSNTGNFKNNLGSLHSAGMVDYGTRQHKNMLKCADWLFVEDGVPA